MWWDGSYGGIIKYNYIDKRKTKLNGKIYLLDSEYM